MASLTVINNEPDDGETVTVQIDGDAPESLSPGQQMTINIDKDNEAIISVENGH